MGLTDRLWQALKNRAATSHSQSSGKSAPGSSLPERPQVGTMFAIAQHRLDHQKRGSQTSGQTSGTPFFTSDLSTNEYLLARQAGCDPIGLVMGSSFYNVGFFSNFWGYRDRTGEVDTLTQAQLAARELAVGRLQQEAALLGAHGVIGVRLQRSRGSWVPGLLEFKAIGTAIRIPGQPATPTPFTSDLSGQDFWKLHQAGYSPKGLAFGVCSYYVHSDRATRFLMNPTAWSWLFGNSRRNQELVQYSQGFQDARELAISRLTAELQELGADGAVGMTIESSEEVITYNPQSRLGCFLSLFWLGLFLVCLIPLFLGQTNPILFFGGAFLIFFLALIPINIVGSIFGNSSVGRDLLIHFVAIGTAIQTGTPPPENPFSKTLMIMPLNRRA
jgi:uncharacterized protein YbjQ (UPF0145 family)